MSSCSSLHSGPKSHSWSGTHPLFLHFSTQAQLSGSLNSTQTDSYFSHHLDGSRRNEELFLYNCAVTSFWLLQNLHKVHENYDIWSRGTVSGRCSKRHVPKTMANVKFCSEAQQHYRFNETGTWYLTSPKECIYAFLCFEKGLKTLRLFQQQKFSRPSFSWNKNWLNSK